jgi:predicted ATP-binding protein involved in virulence
MKMKSMKLQDFRCWRNYKIDFADRFNLLIGDNAAGKTAIIEALAIGLGYFISGAFHKENFPMATNDVRREAISVGQERASANFIENELTFGAVLNGLGGRSATGGTDVWTIGMRDSTGIVSGFLGVTEDVERIIRDSPPEKEIGIILPLLSYFQSCRSGKVDESQKIETGPPASRLDGYINCLHPSTQLAQFLAWFKKYEFMALQQNARRGVFEAVRKAITNCIDDAQDLRWDIERDELVIRLEVKGRSAQELPFNLLSDGYRNMLAMVGDLAHRAAILNPHLGENAARDTPGIVLIDEIDLHLHPGWQKIVVKKLMDTFPKVQFVATTHSPFIIQSLYQEKDVQVWDMGQAKALPIETMSIEDIAELMQGVAVPQRSQKYQDMMETAERYYHLLERSKEAKDGELKQIEDQLNELTERFSDDVAYHAFLKMQRQCHDRVSSKS